MPVTSVLEPVLEAVDWLISAGQVAWSVIEVGLMVYLIFGGGWLDMIRLISFWLDTLIIKYIDQFYTYFDKILANQIFAPDVVDGVMKRIYIFVSLLVLIKVMMLFIKYITNPELVSDEKLGSSSLVRRVILGMCGMLFLPTIFNLAVGIQKAVLSDNLFGKILLEESQIKEFEKDKNRVGRILAFNVYQAFWNIDRSQVTDQGIIDKYEKANAAYDPSAMGGLFSINEKDGDTYAIDYFPIASSVVLIYVLYLVIKYCLDVVVRMFKLFLLQMIGPLAISDYMINGDSKDVFKNWLKTTISVYAMLFVRIFSIWFIAFVTQLMKNQCPTALEDGVCPDSLLYMGAEPDYLLRGIITLGLLALLMDLPKFFSDLFGLDLEQDASVKGIMQKAGGALKGVAMGGLAFGGAAVGGAIGSAKALGGTLSKATGLSDAMKNAHKNRMNKPQSNGKLATMGRKLSSAASESGLKEHTHSAVGGMVSAALNSNSVTGTAYKGYSQQQQEQKGVDDKAKQAAKERKAAKEREEDVVRNITERVVETLPNGTSKEEIRAAVVGQLVGVDSATVSAQVQGELNSITKSGQTVDAGEITQTVRQVLGDKVDVTPQEVEQVVKQVVKDPANVTPAELEQVVNQVIGKSVASQADTIDQVVNQVYGTRVNNSVDDATQKVVQEIERVNTTVEDATQKVTQQLEQVVTNTEEINVYSEISTEHIEHMRQQVDLQRSSSNDNN